MKRRNLSLGFIAKMVKDYLPRGWKLVEKEKEPHNTSGLCAFGTKTIRVPPIINHYNLFVFIHECVHAHLKHDKSLLPEHMVEFEAERCALAIFKKHRLRADRYIRLQARLNVAKHCKEDRERKIPINQKVWKWCNPRKGLMDKARYQRRTLGFVGEDVLSSLRDLPKIDSRRRKAST